MRCRNTLLKLASRAEATVYMASKVMAFIAAIVLLAMVLITVADVVGRYFFNHPINGAWEITGLLLVCAGPWGLAYCQVEKKHITVTVLLDRFSPRGQAFGRCVAYLIGLTVFSLMCWETLILTHKYILTKGYITDTLHIPLYPFMLILAIGAGMLMLVLFIDVVRSIMEVARR